MRFGSQAHREFKSPHLRSTDVPGSAPTTALRSGHAAAPHLRLAPGPVPAPRRPARRPGRLHRPPGRDGALRAGRRGAGRRRRLRPGDPAARRGRAVRAGVRPDPRGRRAGRGHQRQPRQRPPARLQRRRCIDAAASSCAPTWRRPASPIVIDGVPFFAVPYLEPAGAPADAPRPRGPHRSARPGAGRGAAAAVVLAHCWVAGGAACDSERDLTVGGVSRCPRRCSTASPTPRSATCTAPRCCRRGAALQRLAAGLLLLRGRPHEGVVAGRTVATGLARVEFVPAPVPRRLSALRGDLAALLTDAALAAQEHDWLSVVLTDAARPEEAMARLSRALPARARPRPRAGRAARGPPSPTPRGSPAAPTSRSTAAFVEHVRGTPADRAEQALLAQALDAGRSRREASA